MGKINYCAVALFAVLALTGCSKKEAIPGAHESLAGIWTWERTDGGFGYHIHETPASTGKNVQLTITTDGQYQIYTNNVITSTGTYMLETRQCIHDHTSKMFINFSNENDTDVMVEKVDNTQLEVSDEANDGLNSRYVRVADWCGTE